MYKITTIIDWYTENTHTPTYELSDRVREEEEKNQLIQYAMSQASNVEKEVMMMMVVIIALGFVWFNNFRLRFFGYARRVILYTVHNTHTNTTLFPCLFVSFTLSLSLSLSPYVSCWFAGTQPSTKTNAQRKRTPNTHRQRQRQRE